jgi:hypothetical protein
MNEQKSAVEVKGKAAAQDRISRILPCLEMYTSMSKLIASLLAACALASTAAAVRAAAQSDLRLTPEAEVLRGTMVRFSGREPTMMQTGSSFMNLRRAPHAGFTVVGDRPLRLLTVHVVDKEKPLYEWVK